DDPDPVVRRLREARACDLHADDEPVIEEGAGCAREARRRRGQRYGSRRRDDESGRAAAEREMRGKQIDHASPTFAASTIAPKPATVSATLWRPPTGDFSLYSPPPGRAMPSSFWRL